MNSVFQRIFSTSKRLPSESRQSDKLTLLQLQQTLQGAIHDCGGMRAQRVTHKIGLSRNVNDLWLLRSDLHQCISQEHSQSVAADRINKLNSAFAGWVPGSQLTRI